jgi:LDH2 family malate/lactate/ureidoglycolate dehydrogenase
VATGAPGIFLGALDVEAFLPRQEFLARMDAQIDQIKRVERFPGVEELLVPGECGQRLHGPRGSRRGAGGVGELADTEDVL